MTAHTDALRRVISERASKPTAEGRTDFEHALATALSWNAGTARLKRLSPSGLSFRVLQGTISDQPAAMFFGHNADNVGAVLSDAALFAYHSSIEWGVLTNFAETFVFNSHWTRHANWFSLPPVPSAILADQHDLLEALTPRGLVTGQIDKYALTVFEPDQQLLPVDDALVDRLDHWRSQTMRCSKHTTNVDEKLQTLFAQLFVLRAVEDRGINTHVPSLRTALKADQTADPATLATLFQKAKDKIQSDLFESPLPPDIPEFVIGGIIKDLYAPSDLPVRHFKYNFSWIEADVLGRAYEKYLSTVLIPSKKTPDTSLFDRPLREVERVTLRKAAGVYYTPPFIVRYLAERCLDIYFDNTGTDPARLPHVADPACGSGSFLTAVADSIIRRFRTLDPKRNWGRELVTQRAVVGIDADARAITLAQLSLWLRLAEEPAPLPLPRLREIFAQGDSLQPETWRNLPSEFDIILGNPPFQATSRVPNRADLVAQYRTAQGRFDYAYLFVELSLNKLRPNGAFGLVVPNRLFRNRDANAIRELLSKEASITTLVDFGSTQVFSGTSSYVGLIVGKKGQPKGRPDRLRFVSVHALPPRFAGVLLAIADDASDELSNQYLTAFTAQHPADGNPWTMAPRSSIEARLILEEKSELLSLLATVNQGIKTGANDIFVVHIDSGDTGSPICRARNELGDTPLLERACLRPVAFGAEIQRYSVVRPTRMLIYPYEGGSALSEDQFRARYPLTYRYLSSYGDFLAKRTSAISSGRQWFELVRQRDEDWLTAKKLLMRDLATIPSFAIDDTGQTHLIGGTAVVPSDETTLEPLLGYLNSGVSAWYLGHSTPAFRAGFQKFEPQHLNSLPVPREVVQPGDLKDEIGSLARQVVIAHEEGRDVQQKELERRIDKLICRVAGIDMQVIR